MCLDENKGTKQMKTKTTLAALLLAAVMVTPSYGADEFFLKGARNQLRWRDDKKIESLYSLGSFTGYVEAVWDSGQVNAPDGVKLGQVVDIVANYIKEHPAERHEHEIELIKRALKKAWRAENAYVKTTKKILVRPFGRGAVPVARDGN
jgi:hypothetical protein